MERQRVLQGRLQRGHDEQGPGWDPQTHRQRCTHWRDRMGLRHHGARASSCYSIGDCFHWACCAAAWSERYGYADSERFGWARVPGLCVYR